MTKQIERAYRRNRRTSWLLVAAVVVIAAIAIPLASGAPEKNYTLGFDTATQVLTKSVCSGTTTTVDVYLKNIAKSASLGSAQVTVPAGLTIKAITKNGTALPASSVSGLDSANVTMNDLGLAKNEYVTLTVTASNSASGPISAIVKQANNFNDSGGGANLFSDPTDPTTLTVAVCATIKGQIWNDSNEDGNKDSFENTLRPTNGFSVALYREEGASYVSTGIPPTYDGGTYSGYTFSNVPTGPTYVVCEAATTGTWKQTTGATQSACGTPLTMGFSFALNGNVTGKNFGNAKTVTINCENTSSLSPAPIVTTETRYTVKVSGNTCKNGVFVLEAYAPDATLRVANFHPVGDPAGAIYLIEKMEWNFGGTAQPGEVTPTDRSLKYDDDPNADPGLEPMPYCLKDPRANASGVVADPWSLVTTTDVLPGGATSCLMTTTERAGGIPVTDPPQFRREDWIFSSVDGYRLGP